MSRRVLAVKLADIGDVLLTTPALRRLRASGRVARLDVLTTANGAAALTGSTLVDEVITFDKAAFDRVAGALHLGRVGALPAFAADLRRRGYDAVILFHHLTLRFGALKFAGLMLATGAPRRVGLDNGRGWFLTDRVPDRGFGARHEVEYALALAETVLELPMNADDRRSKNRFKLFLDRRLSASIGGSNSSDRLNFHIPETAERAAEGLLAGLGGGPLVALFPGSGGYSLARRWPPAHFAAVADALQRQGARVVLVGRASDNTTQVVAAMTTPSALDLTDRLDLPTLGAVLARADLLLTNDGGPMHIASAVRTPVVAVFGLSNDAAYGPWDGGLPPRLWPPRPDAPPVAQTSRHTVVRLDLGCQPCLYRGHRLGAPQGCATRECLTLLPPRLVLGAVEAALAEIGTTDEHR